MGYIAMRPAVMNGFWGTMFKGSLKAAKAIPVAAAGAAGGVAAAAAKGASVIAGEVKGSEGQQATAEVPAGAEGNILTTLPNSTLAVGGLAGVALIVALARR